MEINETSVVNTDPVVPSVDDQLANLDKRISDLEAYNKDEVQPNITKFKHLVSRFWAQFF